MRGSLMHLLSQVRHSKNISIQEYNAKVRARLGTARAFKIQIVFISSTRKQPTGLLTYESTAKTLQGLQ